MTHKIIAFFLLLTLSAPITVLAQWRNIPPMKYARGEHRVIRLRNGNIMVIGGQNGSSALSSCEIYSPVTNTWSSAASLNIARYRFGIGMLSNGDILVAGGLTDCGTATTATTEIYRVSEDRWEQSTSMHERREGFPMVSLPGNRFACIGGLDGSAGKTLASCEIYDGNGRSFQKIPPLIYPIWTGNATYLPSRNELVVSGGGAGGVDTYLRKNTQIFRFKDSTWYLGDSMIVNQGDLDNHIKLPNDDLLALGGEITFKGSSTNIIERFSSKTGKWQRTGTLNGERNTHIVFTIGSDSILLVGGRVNSSRTSLSTCSWYNLRTHECFPAPSLLEPRALHRGLAITDTFLSCLAITKVYVFGGLTPKGYTKNCEVLTIDGQTANLFSSLPPVIDFGDQACSEAEQTYTLRNPGCDTIYLSQSILNNSVANFSASLSTTCIPPDSSANLAVRFRPSDYGNYSTTLAIQAKNKGRPLYQNISLVGSSSTLTNSLRLGFGNIKEYTVGDTVAITLFIESFPERTIANTTIELRFNHDRFSIINPSEEGVPASLAPPYSILETENGALISLPANLLIKGKMQLLTLNFRTFVTNDNISSISIHSFGAVAPGSNKCYNLFQKDTANISLKDRCGDNTLRSFMRGTISQLKVISLSNSAISVEISGKEAGILTVTDILGNTKFERAIGLEDGIISIPTSGIEGFNIIRFSSKYFTTSKKFVLAK